MLCLPQFAPAHTLLQRNAIDFLNTPKEKHPPEGAFLFFPPFKNFLHKNVNRQIKDIFSSPNFVYKANVSIKLVDGTTQEKTIIGRTNNSLITIDDELIDVSKISQIDFLD